MHSPKYGHALECLLTALMGIGRGLPQGVPASDRFADDYLMPASSLREARAHLRLLEEALRAVGMTLNDEKTAIMRQSTYARGLESQRRAVPDLVHLLGRSCEMASGQPSVTSQGDDADEGTLEHLATAWDSIIDPVWDDKAPTWTRVAVDATPAMQSEMLLAAAIEPTTPVGPDSDWASELGELRRLLQIEPRP